MFIRELSSKDLTIKAKDSLVNNDVLIGELTSVMVIEVLDYVGSVYAELSPSIASSVISNHWRFDVNVPGGDGTIDILDLSLIIYNYYLSMSGDSDWIYAKVFDANNDGIINLSDILIISSYFT